MVIAALQQREDEKYGLVVVMLHDEVAQLLSGRPMRIPFALIARAAATQGQTIDTLATLHIIAGKPGEDETGISHQIAQAVGAIGVDIVDLRPSAAAKEN